MGSGLATSQEPPGRRKTNNSFHAVCFKGIEAFEAHEKFEAIMGFLYDAIFDDGR